MDMNNVLIIKNSFDLIGNAYKYLLGNLVRKNTTNVPPSFKPKKKSERRKCQNSNFFSGHGNQRLCVGAHQESPQ
jgi:hypothetical protein